VDCFTFPGHCRYFAFWRLLAGLLMGSLYARGVCCLLLRHLRQQERRKAEEERLLSALAQPLGFHRGRPVAALVIFRSCLHWRAFQVESPAWPVLVLLTLESWMSMEIGAAALQEAGAETAGSSVLRPLGGMHLQADRTSLFDRIIGVVGAQVEKQQDDNSALAYW
jgi:myosin V